MFDKNSFIRLMYTILISILITMIVLALNSDNAEVIFLLLKGILAGTVIWFLGELLFPLCEKIFPRSIIPGYIVLIILIFGGTAIFGYVFGVKSISVLVKMCVAAEIFGIGIVVIYRINYIKSLNEKLEHCKKDGFFDNQIELSQKQIQIKNAEKR